MDARLLFLREWIREGFRFLCRACVYGGTASQTRTGLLSVRSRERVSAGRRTFEISDGVQHALAIRSPAGEFALHVYRAEVRSNLWEERGSSRFATWRGSAAIRLPPF